MFADVILRALGLEGYNVLKIDFDNLRGVLLRIELPYARRRCSACGSANCVGRGGTLRSFRSVPLGRTPMRIEITIPKVQCHDCSLVRQVEIGFADPRRSYTKAFERYALELCRHMTIADVAAHLKIGWDAVKDMQKRWLSMKYARPHLRHIRRLAIDEISVAKGHKYLTVVMDLDAGVVVFVGDGKGADALKPFWTRLKRSHAKIEAVAIDMSPAYIEAVGNNLPEAAVVFDRFHVVKLFNERLSDLRRELHREAINKLHKDVLKGTRWILMKNPENLDPGRNERARLDEALLMNKPLATAYYLKEDLRQLWNRRDKRSADRFLSNWIARAEASGIRILKSMAKTLAGHRAGLLAWYDHRISTGPLEGTNNKIKTMKRMAYGYRDHEFFKLKILALHETRYALVG